MGGLGYSLEVCSQVRDFLCEKGFDAQWGARPLKRAIQEYLEDPLADAIIQAPGQDAGYRITLNEDKSQTLVSRC